MDIFTGILENTAMPWISALILGLMTAVSPCPLATNITAIGYISKDVKDRNRVFLNGVFYTLGRAISYTLIALIIYLGADQLRLSGLFQRYGEKFVGPLLIIIGLFMLGILTINFPAFARQLNKIQRKSKWGYWDAVLLGMLFALAFCPYSGVLFFGILIPMTVASPSGLYLPVLFAVSTGIPVIIFAWLLAYTVSSIGIVYNIVRLYEMWFRKIIAALFIIVGIYYIFRVYW
jgi:cytochrome c-type biogenesis protein